MKRLVSIDIFRGVAIIGVIAIHALLFNLDYHPAGSMYDSPVTTVILYFMSWAGVFAVISGIGNALSLYGRIRQGIWTPKKALFNSLLGGTIYLIMNYVYMWFFVPGYPPMGRTAFFQELGKTGGVLFWLIRDGQWFFPSPEQTMYATALEMIGWGIIVSGICVYLVTRKGQKRVSTRNYTVLGIIATLFMVGFPLVQTPLRALIDPLLPLSWDNMWPIIGTFFLAWFVAPMNPIFPYVGFSIYGVIFSLMIVDKVDKRKIFAYGYMVGAIWSLIGFTYIAAVMNRYWIPPFDTPPFPNSG